MLMDVDVVHLADGSVIASACASMAQYDHLSIAQAQSHAVRMLLQSIMANHKLLCEYHLVELSYPFYLAHPYRSKRYVSFSHSYCRKHNRQKSKKEDLSLQMALVIADDVCGIDVECNQVSSVLVRRFFHPNELALLANMPKAHSDFLIKRLWQLKEAWIKAKQSRLLIGMGMDFSGMMAQLSHLGYHAVPFGRLYVDDKIVALICH